MSWILEAGDPHARGLRQTAYRIIAASSERALGANTGDLWDTGKLESEQSVQVAYCGKPLASGAAVFWKVRVWDQDGRASAWSAPAQWSMGLLRSEDWQAKWIGREEAGVYQDATSPYAALEHARWIWYAPDAKASAPAGDRFFRETFAVPSDRGATRAICIAGADSQAEVFFNGEKIAAASNAVLPQAVDVTRLLHAGDNVVAVRATHSATGGPAG